MAEARRLLGPDLLVGWTARTRRGGAPGDRPGRRPRRASARSSSRAPSRWARRRTGSRGWRAACRALPVPVVAISGIGRDNIAEVARAGAACAAVIEALFGEGRSAGERGRARPGLRGGRVGRSPWMSRATAHRRHPGRGRRTAGATRSSRNYVDAVLAARAGCRSSCRTPRAGGSRLPGAARRPGGDGRRLRHPTGAVRRGAPRRLRPVQARTGPFEKEILEAALAAGAAGAGHLRRDAAPQRGAGRDALPGPRSRDAGIGGHEQPAPKDVPTHPVKVAAGSLLARLLGPGVPEHRVNSTHHQAVREPGTGVLVARHGARRRHRGDRAARTCPSPSGVQWHPEAVLEHDPRQAGLFAGLVEAARGGRR